jgi:hypothetical protein
VGMRLFDSLHWSNLPSAEVASSSSSTDGALTAAAVQLQLQQAGLALCSMAVPCLCNNPVCTNTSGPTELSLVSGRSSARGACGGCRVAHCCCQTCQAQHWKRHKPVRTALTVAAAAASATVLK